MTIPSWTIVLVHLMGNPVLPTTLPSFPTLVECQVYAGVLNVKPSLWSYVCWRSE